MKNRLFAAIIIIVVFARISYAQDEPMQAINVCAIAIPVLNQYIVNYEYLYNDRHGLATRIEYAPNLKGSETKGVAFAGVINYRWHFSSKLKNFFVGPYFRYRYAYGSGKAKLENYDFNVSEAHIGINGGYRWISKMGINVVIAGGYGYSFVKENLSSKSNDVKSVFSAFKKANDANTSMFDAPFYGEVSVGYAF